MKQALLRKEAAIGSATLYLSLAPSLGSNSFGFIEIIWPVTGTFRNLAVTLATAPGVGTTRTFTLMLNGVATALACVISGTATQAQNTSNSVSVTAGQRVLLQATNTGVPVTTQMRYVVEFDNASNYVSAYGANFGTVTSGFGDPFTGSINATALDCERVMPCAGFFTQMYGTQTFSAMTAPNGLDVFIYKNGVKQDGTGGTVNTKLSITGIAADGVVNNAFVLSVVRGDTIYLGFAATGAYIGSGWCPVGVRFESVDPYESIVAMGPSGDPSASSAEYAIMSYNRSTGIWLGSNTIDTQLYGGITTMYLRNLTVRTVDPGGSAQRKFELMRNGTVTAASPTVTVVGGQTTGQNSIEMTILQNDVVGPMRHTPTSTPVVTPREWWSLVMSSVAKPADPDPPAPIPTGGGGIPPGPAPSTGPVPINPKWYIKLITPANNTYYFAETTLNDDPTWPVGGFKPAKLLDVSDIERILDTSYKLSTWSFNIADLLPTRAWRTIADTETIEGSTATLYGIDDDVRLAGGQPWRASAGEVSGHETGDGMRYNFEVGDACGSRLTAFASETKIPPHPLLRSEFPQLDSSMDGKFAPIALGKVVNGRGMAPGKYMGTADLSVIIPGANPGLVDGYLFSEFACAGVGGMYFNLPTWGPLETHSLGWFVRPTSGKATGLYYVVVSAGTTGTTEPAWPIAIGMTVVDGSVQWQAYAADDPSLRFLVPDVAFNTVLIASFKPGWSLVTGLSTQYVDLGGRRYGVVAYIDSSFVYAKAIKEGRITLSFDIYGVTASATGSGAYIDTPEQSIIWIFAELVFKDSTGVTYFPMPLIDGYEAFDSVSRAASEAVAVSRVAGGYVSAVLLGRGGAQQSGFTCMQEFTEGGDLELGPNRHGQCMFAREDPAAAAIRNLDDLRDLDRFKVATATTSNINWMQARYGFKYTPDTAQLSAPSAGQPLPPGGYNPYGMWESEAIVVQDTTAQTLVKRIKRVNFDNYVINKATVGASVYNSRFFRLRGPSATRDGRKVFVAEGGLGLLGVELNDVLGITTELGLGASGYVGKTVRVRSITLSPMRGRITLKGSVLHPYT